MNLVASKIKEVVANNGMNAVKRRCDAWFLLLDKKERASEEPCHNNTYWCSFRQLYHIRPPPSKLR